MSKFTNDAVEMIVNGASELGAKLRLRVNTVKDDKGKDKHLFVSVSVPVRCSTREQAVEALARLIEPGQIVSKVLRVSIPSPQDGDVQLRLSPKMAASRLHVLFVVKGGYSLSKSMPYATALAHVEAMGADPALLDAYKPAKTAKTAKTAKPADTTTSADPAVNGEPVGASAS